MGIASWLCAGCSLLIEAGANHCDGADCSPQDASSPSDGPPNDQREVCIGASFAPEEPILFEEALTFDLIESASDPALTVDEQFIYFTHQPSDKMHREIFRASMNGNGAFAEAQSVTILDTPTTSEASLKLSEDGRTLRFSRIRDDGERELLQAKLGAAGWSVPQVLEAYGTDDELFPPRLLADPSLEVYAGKTLQSIAELRTLNPGQSSSVAAVNEAGANRSPWVSADGLLMVVARRINTDDDLYFSYRASTALDWPAPVPIADVNTTDDEKEAWMSEDTCTLYFAREDQAGITRIFRARRQL